MIIILIISIMIMIAIIGRSGRGCRYRRWRCGWGRGVDGGVVDD
jgi:hypothetical protein